MVGLLDYLYDPSTYGGQAGGLLSRLQPMIGALPQSQGFPESPQQPNPIAMGGYQMPRVGNPDLYQPQQVNTPPNAQPAQGQMPQPEQMPSFLQENKGGIGAGLRGFANNLHAGPIGALVGGVGSAFGMQDQSQNDARALFNAYKAAGLEPSKAMLAVMNPRLAETMLGMGGQTDDIKEYQFAKRENPSLTFEKFMQQKKAVSGEYSLTPQYGTDEKGNTVLLQTGKSGEAIRTKLPEGVKVSSGVEKIDLGTEWGIIDKRTGSMVGRQPKDIVGKESAEEVGKVQGQAKAELPAAELTVKRTVERIDSFINSKGFSQVFGALDQFRPNWTMDDAGRESLSKFKQLEGSAFLEGRKMLKGGGAITDFESKKAEAAIARLERSLNETDAKKALEDFKDAIRDGAAKLRASAGNPAQAPSAPTTKRIRLNADGTIAQ